MNNKILNYYIKLKIVREGIIPDDKKIVFIGTHGFTTI